MIELKTLTFKNVRRFTEEQTIDFSDRDKLVQIDGKNNNTGGSSGAGKSTVFIALDYLLGISDIPSTVLQSRLTKDGISVSGTFLVNGKELNILRSKKEGLVVEYDGEAVSGNVKLGEEKLDEIIGIPRSVFKKMIHKKQKEGGFFIDMTGKQTYEFLTSVLNLDKYSEYHDIIAENVRKDHKELDEINVKLQLEKSTLADFERMLSEKKKPETDVDPNEIERLRKRVDEIDGRKLVIDAGYSSQLSILEEPQKKTTPYDTSKADSLYLRLEEAKEKMATIIKAQSGIESQMARLPLLEQNAKKKGEEIAELTRQKAEIEKAICPTCEQNWVGETAKAKVDSIGRVIDVTSNEILDIKKELDKKPELIESVDRLAKMKTAQEEEIKSIDFELQLERNAKSEHDKLESEKYAEEIKAFNKKQIEIQAEHAREVEPLEKEKDLLADRISKLNTKYALYLQASESYESEVSKLKEVIANKTKTIEALAERQEDLKGNTIVADETKRLIKTFILQTFQDTLDTIGEVATEILSGVPNMSNSTIYFEGCKENKDGSIKNEVSGIINMDGENVPIKSLSGGERTAIDLAVDLAVIDVIESKAGKGADFYIIDEPFDGLDAVCRENYLEILKQIDTNKKIIMVDHSSELKEMVTDVITVVRDGEFSTIQQ